MTRRARRWDALAALIAALIGLLALCVSGYTAWLQRQQVRAQVWPYLQTGIAPNKHTVNVDNKGVGPAQVRLIRLYVDGKPMRTWPQAFDALGLPDLRESPPSTIGGIVISPGESVQQMSMHDADAFARFYAQYRRIQMAICYCSALDECWMLDEHAVPPEARTMVSACPRVDADSLHDDTIAALPGMASTPKR